MANQWPAPLLASGGINPYGGAYVGFSTAQPVGLPRFESPILATTTEYIFDQEWMQYRSSFSATALNTAHPSAGLTPDYSGFVLVNEGPRRDVGGGLVQWTRRYAIVPSSYDDFQSVSYNFIAFIGIIAMGNFWQFSGVTAATVTGRPRVAWKVDCRISYDFFLVGSHALTAVAVHAGGAGSGYAVNDVLQLAGGTLAATGSAATVKVTAIGGGGAISGIAVLNPGAYSSNPSSPNSPTNVIGAGSGANLDVTFNTVSTPGDIPIIKRQRYLGPAIASVGVDSDWVMDAAAGITATTPDRTTYSGWIVNAATYGWSSGVAPSGSNPGQIVSEDSILTRWAGNIWQRQSFFVLAQ